MAYTQSSFSNVKIDEEIALIEKDGGARRQGLFKGSTTDGVTIYWTTDNKEFTLSYSQMSGVLVKGGQTIVNSRLNENGTVTAAPYVNNNPFSLSNLNHQ
jgi:hypothetical protein